MWTAIIDLLKKLIGAGKTGDLDATALGVGAATALFDAWIGSSDIPDEGKVALREQRDVLVAVMPVIVAWQKGEKPTKAVISKLQSERVQADMAMGALIGSIPTSD